MFDISMMLAVNSGDMGENLMEGLGLTVVGMLVVFTALVVIGQMIRWGGVLLREKPASEAADPDQVSPIVQGEPAPSMDDDDAARRLVAVLTAAATVALNRPVLVHRVRHLSPRDTAGWVYAARAGMHRQPAYRKGRP